MSERTKAALLKQLNEVGMTNGAATNKAATTNRAMPATNAPANAMTRASNSDDDETSMTRANAAGGGGRRGGAARREMLATNAPLPEAARIAALILGSPEFQRQ